MTTPQQLSKRILTMLAIGLLSGLVACSDSPGASPAAVSQPDDLAALKQQMAAQATRIAMLETREASSQARVVALETKGAALQLAVQAKPTSGGATVTPKPAQPTPTIIPPVAGLVTEGATKGAATAKVTITEYSDYL
jgi:protein-disulfide isomerase